MLKKITLAFVALILYGCSSTSEISTKGGVDTNSLNVTEVNFGDKENFRVGVLLPLSGTYATQGQGLKKATLMALDDVKNNKLIVQFYDTKSSDTGARIAAQNAINQNVNMILGPLTSVEVRAISEQAKDKNIPVIAFSTATEVLDNGIFTLGLLIDEQVDRVITHSAKKGRSKLALFLPDNTTGVAVAKSAIKSAKQNNIEVTRIGFYPQNATDFSSYLKDFTDYNRRKARADKLKANLEAQQNAGNLNAAKILKRLNTVDSLGSVDFDMLLIPETGPKLKSAVSMLGYYDVFYPQVQLMGTSIWENSNLNNESTLIKGVYPALSRVHSSYFANKYNSIFGQRPSALYSFAYDGVALASALSKQDSSNIKSAITNPDGYIGINGVFRLFDNGRNQHSLDVVEVRREGDSIIDYAPRKFNGTETNILDTEIVFDEQFKAPLIFGKDKYLTYNAIFGTAPAQEFEHSSYISPEREKEILGSSLAKLNIILPN